MLIYISTILPNHYRYNINNWIKDKMSRIINEFIYLTLYLYKYQINDDGTLIHNIYIQILP